MRKDMMILAAAAALGALLVASSASTAYALGYTFTDINVPGSQPGSTGAYDGLAINNLGQIAGSYVDNAGNYDGFLYTGGRYVTVDAPGAIDTNLYGINDFGQVLGTAGYSNGTSQNFIDTHGKFSAISNAISPAGPANPLNDRDQVFGSAGFPDFGILNPNGVITPIDLSGAPAPLSLQVSITLISLRVFSLTAQGPTLSSTRKGSTPSSTTLTKPQAPTRGMALTTWVRSSARISIARATITVFSTRMAISRRSMTQKLPSRVEPRP